jgi:hypothetical protein
MRGGEWKVEDERVEEVKLDPRGAFMTLRGYNLIVFLHTTQGYPLGLGTLW